ncbi:serine/threonine-protein kinase [Streptosporangium sp. KLBMP 9127]|nr:serine/threonine protein kinase [Streptosporangium sp. KLBMP 9127]
MPARPLLSGDPAVVGGHRIVGRLGEGGQGVVYLGESPDGTPVAVKLVRPALDDGPGSLARFGKEIELARRVKAFCTAQVLATGEAGGLPYIVSEYVDGPSLAQAIIDRGSLDGAELRRVAIGTLTALAAIHQAGVVHRDFKPGNVLLSRDGPRVIDFGISQALEVTEQTSDVLVGTPAYMAPEQFSGERAGPPADLFAWAATVVCTATGRPPFGSGELPALINKIVYGEPALGDLDGGLRELVMSCLAKDPAARPTATRALLTLLGHPVPPQRLLEEGQQSAAPPAPPERRRPLLVGTTVVAVVALLAAGGFWAVRAANQETVERPGATGATTPARVPPTPRSGPMPLSADSELTLPDTRITLHETEADPTWVTSYRDSRPEGLGVPSYVRDPASRAFAFFGTFQEPVVSPGGAYVAALAATRLTRTDFETVRLVDRTTGEDLQIRTVDKPASTFQPRWTSDGRFLLLSVFAGPEGARRTTGFVIVDAAARSARVVTVASSDKTDHAYLWDSTGTKLVRQAPEGAVRVYDLDGRVVRTLRSVGELVGNGMAATSLGDVIVTKCPDKAGYFCLWDGDTGAPKTAFRPPKGTLVHGWLDGKHMMATVPDGKVSRIVLIDLRGKVVRTLVDGPKAELDEVVVWFTPK